MARVLSDETSLSGRRGRLRREASVLRRLIPIEAGAAVLLLAVGGFTRSAGWTATAVVLGFLAVAHGATVRRDGLESKSIKAGLRGESKVAAELARGLDYDHYVFNDVSLRSGLRTAQIDHVVVGPGGVFVVETKNWGGHVTGGPRDPTWTQQGDAARPPRRHENPVLQNERHVRVLEACLKAAGVTDYPVISVLVFASRGARIDADPGGAALCTPAGLPGFIAAHAAPPRLSVAQIDAIVARLQRVA